MQNPSPTGAASTTQTPGADLAGLGRAVPQSALGRAHRLRSRRQRLAGRPGQEEGVSHLVVSFPALVSSPFYAPPPGKSWPHLRPLSFVPRTPLVPLQRPPRSPRAASRDTPFGVSCWPHLRCSVPGRPRGTDGPPRALISVPQPKRSLLRCSAAAASDSPESCCLGGPRSRPPGRSARPPGPPAKPPPRTG